MDRLTKLRDWAGKYTYAIAVVLLGVLLMLLPSGSRRETRSAAPTESDSRSGVQSEMEATLAAFDGVGRLRLMLTADPVTERWTGAVVVCEGGDGAAARLQLTRAIGALTGLSSDKIAIVKGKP